jgi:hypothetical protein
VELIGHHASDAHENDFAHFVDHNPALLDKRLLLRFYHSSTLAGPQAKQGWVVPDLAPFPWQQPNGHI